MEGSTQDPPTAPRPRRWKSIAAAVGSGICVGLMAALPQAEGVSLVGIQSLAAGAVLSILLVGACAACGARPPRWRAALLAAVVAVGVEHAWLYRTAMAHRRAAAAEQPAVELFRPGWSEQSFFDYMSDEATTQTVSLWALDACLLTAAAVVIVEYNAKRQTTSGE